MKTSRVVLGVIAGAAVGALIGVLFAPDKGSNTRRKIARKGEEWMDDVKVNLKERVDHIRDQAGDVVDRFAEKLHTPKEEMKAKAENGRSKYAHAER
jgi:gas vesicle protein